MLRDWAYYLIVYQYVILIYFLLLALVYSGIIIYAFNQLRKIAFNRLDDQDLENLLQTSNSRPISIIIPAYNESINIIETILSAQKCSYPEFEIVIVNDGSTDDTLQILKDHFSLFAIERPIQKRLNYKKINVLYASKFFSNIYVVDKVNGGKADALNAGLDVSQYPLFCAMDADSLLESDSLMRMANHFLYDKNLVASGGSVRVLNGCEVVNGSVTRVKAPGSIIERIQIAEYLRGFLAGRVVWDRMHSLLIISGAFGVFRKDLIHSIGGYRRTVGEDMDLVVRLHRYCVKNKLEYHVAFDPEPVCWTQVPSDFRSILLQRNRWQRGLVSALWYSRGMFLNPHYGAVAFIAYPYFLFIELLGPFIELTGYFSVIIFFLFGWISLDFLILFLVLAVFWGALLNVSAVVFDNLISKRYESNGDIFKVALTSAIEFLGYRQVVDFERAIGTLFAWRSKWGHPKRKPIAETVVSAEDEI
ncbi:glycosyl transferase [Acidithiobacillus marinus]|uniref:Glycosyl transferase n=2 Tax=Acidithiobacillus marinus TaxID=187490 RepID=A0A2I1DKX1_9PROT|nr:glycosyl transferase [Acidithiobacillus marinus]